MPSEGRYGKKNPPRAEHEISLGSRSRRFRGMSFMQDYTSISLLRFRVGCMRVLVGGMISPPYI